MTKFDNGLYYEFKFPPKSKKRAETFLIESALPYYSSIVFFANNFFIAHTPRIYHL